MQEIATIENVEKCLQARNTGQHIKEANEYMSHIEVLK